MTYFDNLCSAMEILSKHPKTIFLGQAVVYPGTAMFNTLKNVPMEKRLELPVAEDMQLGMAIGMSLNGYIPICLYPRINFLLLAMNQLILHLDKLPEYGNGYMPKVIIRTAIASNTPMDPGPQHLGDFSWGIQLMVKNIGIRHVRNEEQVHRVYREALKGKRSWLIVEELGAY